MKEVKCNGAVSSSNNNKLEEEGNLKKNGVIATLNGHTNGTNGTSNGELNYC